MIGFATGGLYGGEEVMIGFATDGTHGFLDPSNFAVISSFLELQSNKGRGELTANRGRLTVNSNKGRMELTAEIEGGKRS